MPPNQFRKLTEEQREIVEAPEKFLTVTAYAGTGKTTTLKAFAAARPKEKILYLAFNRTLADDSRRAFVNLKNVEVKTIHSLAWYEIGRHFKEYANLRALDILPYVEKYLKGSLLHHYGVARLVLDVLNDWMLSSKRNLNAFIKDRSRRITAKVREFNADSPNLAIRPKSIGVMVNKVWEDCQNGTLKMPHNGYLKLFQVSQASNLSRFDRILVDEAQDLNECMIDVVLSNDSQKVFVGDPYQQIYGFNGAVNALAKAAEAGATPYFLTQSFRCPGFVAHMANQYLKLLGAPKPFKGLAGPPESLKKTGELVIARTNAGLFDFVAKKLSPNRFYYSGGFEGYEFGTILDVVRLIMEIPQSVSDKFMKNFSTIGALEDYADRARDAVLSTRIRIAKRYRERSFNIFQEMFKNQTLEESAANFIVTTAHKIKGQEYESVYLLDDFVAIEDIVSDARKLKKQSATIDQGPKPQANLPFSLEEFRLVYVSMTRSFSRLDIPKRYMITDSMIEEFNALCSDGFIELKDSPPA
ncbi:MAG: AAA family ATPase [Deltaproteobacteria bacterium]|jgi:superfamily I DNA/RNA helicase|nr:AAA family ATPase [Deltaproteobacteria bacterium]